MKKSLYFFIPTVFAFNISSAHALDIDEKLTLRFLKVSSTKKTVLINRGGEDGLVVGDHAKFFITAGVVARGISEKVSPSRSVWSLYRIVDPSEIVEDKVLNLKIATPVKITDDPSKSLKEEVIPGGTETMNVEDNGNQGEVVITDEDKDELKGLGVESDSDEAESEPEKTVSKPAKSSQKNPTNVSANKVEEVSSYGGKTSKTWEAWGMLYFNSLSGTEESSNDDGSTNSISAAGSAIDFSAGIEKYFTNFNNFFKEVSVNAFIHKKTIESGSEIKAKGDWLEYGLGANYHFYNSAASTNRLIGYAAATVGKGDATLETKSVINGTDGGATIEGSNTFFSLGLGAKYLLSNGFGIRAILDYYSSSETYEFDDSTTTSNLAGPRIQFGLSYRF